MRTVRERMLRLFIVVVVLLLFVSPVAAQNLSFTVPEMICNVYINDDGSIYIDYQITFTADPGSAPIDIVDIGLPNTEYKLSNIKADVGGVAVTDVRQSTVVHPGVEVHLGKFTIQPGSTGSLHVLALVGSMLFQDTSDPTYASMEFSPTYFEGVHGTTHLETIIHFPKGVTADEARYHGTKFTDSAIMDGLVTYAYIYDNAVVDRLYPVGVSFPKKYLASGVQVKETPTPIPVTPGGGSTGSSFLNSFCGGPACVFLAAFLFIIGIIVISARANSRKMKYLPPGMAVEGVGIKRGLTAVEAAILLEAPLNKILTMVLFGLLKKGAVTVLTNDPLTLQVNQPTPTDLRDYEKDFIAAVHGQKLDEKDLRKLMVNLIKSVNDKMKGFSRKDSVAYYKDLVRRAWEQVETADSPEVKSQMLDDGLEWTVLEDDWEKRVGRTFGDQPVPLPPWWVFYRPWVVSAGPVSSGGGGTIPASTTSAPSVGGGGRAPTMPTLPGAAFAGSIVSGFQNVASSVVSSIERFTGSVSSITNPPPPPPPSSSGRWHGGGGGGGCACACACAGCACACAGGGR